MALFWFEKQWWSLIVSVALSLFSLWRFFNLRWKNSESTYQYFIILCDLERLFMRDEKAPRSEGGKDEGLGSLEAAA
jgi:hypothetical protein